MPPSVLSRLASLSIYLYLCHHAAALPLQYSMSYMRQVNEHVALACDFEAVVANLESTMNCGWKYSLRPCTIQAMLNSEPNDCSSKHDRTPPTH